MYVLDYKEEYFDAMVKLESEVYPEGIRWGPEMMAAEIDCAEDPDATNTTLLAFRDGELKGYIIANRHENKVYIADLLSIEPKALMYLLSIFFLNSEFMHASEDNETVYVAECRDNSLQLLLNKRCRSFVSIVSKERHEDYYTEGEPTTTVDFTVAPNKVKDLRLRIISCFYSYNSRAMSMSALFDFARNANLSVEEIKKQKRFIITSLNQWNFDLYRMFGKEIPCEIVKRYVIRNDTVETVAQNYVDKGFREKKASCQVTPKTFMYVHKGLSVCDTLTYSNVDYGDLSSARYIARKIKKQIRTAPHAYVIMHNRYGGELTSGSFFPPYCNRRTWDIEMRYFEAEITITKGVCGENLSWDHAAYHLRDLSKAIGFKEAYNILHSIAESSTHSNQHNFIHDWNELISSLLGCRVFLTKGALISIMKKTYQKAAYWRNKCSAVHTQMTSIQLRISSNTYEALTKDIRTLLSNLVKSAGDIDSLVTHLSVFLEELVQKKYNIPGYLQTKLTEYISRMHRYQKYASKVLLLDTFGSEWTRKILREEVPCIFRPEKIYLDAGWFYDEALQFLRSNTKHAKRFYSDLRKLGYHEKLKDRILTGNELEQVHEIIRKRNIKITGKIEPFYMFHAEIEPKCSPEFLTAGDATVCCMRFGSDKAIRYAKEEGIGIINIYYSGRVIANSVIWIEDEWECLVLDNIEVHPNYTRFNGVLRHIYEKVTMELMREYNLDIAVQGEAYSDLKLKPLSEPIRLHLRNGRQIHNFFYSDAISSRVVMSLLPKEKLLKKIRSADSSSRAA